MSTARTSPTHKAPLVFEPTEIHTTTMIVLHGRGSTAERFAEPFLTSLVAPRTRVTRSQVSELASESTTIFRDYFPNTKFLFPTAPLRRAAAFNRSLTHQWFDKWSPQHPELKQYLQVPGLRETSTYLHGLLQQEINVVGAPNVALVGISQGCASSLVATLLWDGEPFGALAGMCGYLPFRKGMADLMMDEKEDEDNPFTDTMGGIGEVLKRKGEEFDDNTKFGKALSWLREELEMEGGRRCVGPPPMQSIPTFMGHGAEDTLLPHEQGKQAAEFLRAIDVNVKWKEYEGLGHWYSTEMLRDIVDFLKERKGWHNIASTGRCDENGVKIKHEHTEREEDRTVSVQLEE
ncbi:uncharacterized protein N0V89_000622 [Didymosphaeria variabile]|uniref:Phospholipase/carboxylesterase/thioesterase domain-containing protein n=1 Tax=Didymosphaeria variabile TaxID=1932322 RepID=A0A9W9CF43_9PLEO|nr:uncharacterized protein N0V89_000622 [Didymosphaeria variabile]KAJ4360063.1 hypothetical protein N0V89_000622 [Didymosphaeria variabile]